MKASAIRGLLVVVLCATLRTAPAVSAAAVGASSLRSHSGQFVVSTMDPAPASSRLAPTNAAVVELQVPTLVITCERVKQALLRELAYADLWQGRLYVVINAQMTNDQPAAIGARQFTDGWQYRVELPVRSSRLKVVRGLVHALLLEMANRNAVNRSAEVPLWLVEGLTLHLARSSLIDLVAPDPRVTMNRVTFSASTRQAVRPDPLAEARERLQSRTAFSFARLGEVTVDQLSGENWETFQASAQLLVSQLLVLPGGRLALTEMIARLGVHPNWQTAFQGVSDVSYHLKCYCGKMVLPNDNVTGGYHGHRRDECQRTTQVSARTAGTLSQCQPLGQVRYVGCHGSRYPFAPQASNQAHELRRHPATQAQP